jgi:carbon monoxide dehydrogenase subunit G
MALRIQGKTLVDAPRDQVWALLFDVEVMKRIASKVPGIIVERLIQVSEDNYDCIVSFGAAMIRGKFAGTIIIAEKRAPEFVRFRGGEKPGTKLASGEMTLTLTEHEARTLITYAGQGNTGGNIPIGGQRLFDAASKLIIDRGIKALAMELATRHRDTR